MHDSEKGTSARRGIGILVAAALAVAALSITPATAVSFLTKAKAKKLFYTKTQADARFEGQVDWALVKHDGTILDQSGGISVQDHTPGAYFLHFPVPVQGRAIVATLWNGPGQINAYPCGGQPIGADCSHGTNTVNDVTVPTWNSAGGSENRSFYIAVLP